MGIECFYTQSIAIYAFTASATYPFDNAWNAISGSPFKGSFTETSGARSIVGGSSEVRADGYFCLATSAAIATKNKIKWDSRTFEILQIKDLNELSGHHQEIYVKESPEAVL